MNGTVETRKPYGAFVALENGLTGLLHISQISTQRIKHPGAVLKEGQEVRVKILSTADNKISLSMKVLAEETAEAESHSTYDYKEEGQASTGLAALLKNIKLSDQETEDKKIGSSFLPCAERGQQYDKRSKIL